MGFYFHRFKVIPHIDSRSSSEVSEEGSEEVPLHAESDAESRPGSLPLGSKPSTPVNGSPSSGAAGAGAGKSALNAPEYDENGEEIIGEKASAEEEIKESGARFGKWILVSTPCLRILSKTTAFTLFKDYN